MDFLDQLAQSSIPEELKAIIRGRKALESAAYAKRKSSRPPRGNGPVTAHRAPRALPPPHVTVPPRHQDETVDSLHDRVRAARLEKGFRDAAGLPWWAFELAERCHQGRHQEEIARLPRHLVGPVRAAVATQKTEHAQRSLAGLAVVLCWIGYRNPRSVARSTNIGGIPRELFRLLTRRRDGRSYSLSTVGHRTHTVPSTGALGPRGGLGGDASKGEAGFLETLAQCGVLKFWTPPVVAVPQWMQANGYAFSVYRIASPPPQGPPEAVQGDEIPF